MPRRADTLELVGNHAEAIIDIISKAEVSQDANRDSSLKALQRKAEAMLEIIAVMRKYRDLRTRAVYIFDRDDNDLREATKTEKMKICRSLLQQEGLEELDTDNSYR